MGSASTNFDAAAEIFADYGASLRGYVRYQLIRRNLEAVLSKKPLRILDAGGGSGPDAAWLSELGHEVVLVEPSAEQRNYAERRFNFFLQPEQRQRITIFPRSIAHLPADQTDFDVALIHAVAMYQPKPADFIATVAQRVRPGGLLSVVEKGYYGTVGRVIREENFDELQQLERNQRSINKVAHEVYAFKPEELQVILEALPAKIIAWSGIRLLTDTLDTQVAMMESSEVQHLVDLEAEFGQHPDLRAGAQLLHFLARKSH
ncbi:MAG TPA: methyltransferase domain-containing protein [Candidatus Saccharimonadales bacterium]|nr:methyltransferase domain-containing protein [Candidatus Saccharimonadales bacterium]